VLAEQQAIADSFYELKLIPKRIYVRDATLQGAVPGTQSHAKR
jgi:hypothetical protein